MRPSSGERTLEKTMSNLELFEKPEAPEIYMVAGWRQWADSGGTSSGFIEYLINTLGARKIGRIKPDSLYLFQTPVSQFFFRPQAKFEDGHRVSMEGPRNDLYYWEDARSGKGLLLFLGDEPHMNVERYAEAFFEIATTLKVKQVAATGGVYAMVPYDKERNLTCNFSLPGMKAQMLKYAVNLSNYEGPVSIGSYLNDLAETLNVEYFAWYAFVPMYDLSRMTQQQSQGVSVEEDYTAWLGILRRLNHIFGFNIDTIDLTERSEALTAQIRGNIEEMATQMPQVPIHEYISKMTREFEEMRFESGKDVKLSDVWEDALGDLFDDSEKKD
jgi:proteasome assembly chaperone (PAC2) family protein